MASILAFNKIVAGSVTIDKDEFVTGSGSYKVGGTDKTLNTADGKIHFYRISKSGEAVCKIHGDKRALSTPLGTAVDISIYLDDTKIAGFKALASVSFSSEPDVSTITFSGQPEVE